MAFFLFRVIKKTPKKAMRHLRKGDKRNKGGRGWGGTCAAAGGDGRVREVCGGGCSAEKP